MFQFQIQKLRQELAAAQSKIVSLSSHLNTNVTTNYLLRMSTLFLPVRPAVDAFTDNEL